MTAVVVLDIGKTLAKLTLWRDGAVLDKRSRPNPKVVAAAGYPCLDVAGIEAWMANVLADFARQASIDAIVPVAHGAGAVAVDPAGDFIEPIDYEAELPPDWAAAYAAERPAFGETGSPALPAGLNLGAQLFWLEQLFPERFGLATILTWAQFWAWRLSGIAATEVSSLGVHTDLWNPLAGEPSSMAVRRGWARRFAPLRGAGEGLGPVTVAWRELCGLPAHCQVYCGLHDSNADLLAVRSHPIIGAQDLTVVSTGTWFISMRSGGGDIRLPAGRDCLFNVDIAGRPVPSARFMGGRETELLEEVKPQIDIVQEADALVARAAELVRDGVYAVPSFVEGVGPFPGHRGHWLGRPKDQLGHRAAAGLYLALMQDVSLNLIGSHGAIVIGGRFQADPVFTRMLASLRPADRIYQAPSGDSLGHGALSLVDPALVPQSALSLVPPLPFGIAAYAQQWRELIA